LAKHKPTWKDRPENDDYTAAINYLSLQFTTATAKRLVKQARRGTCIERIAKDILRASNLPLLPTGELRVAENLKKIRKGKALAPIILVQGDLTKARSFVIADGYHRLCAACHVDEDAPIASVMVGL
jgi:hypothetical protein